MGRRYPGGTCPDEFADPLTWPEPDSTTDTDTDRCGTAVTAVWYRLHPKITHLGSAPSTRVVMRLRPETVDLFGWARPDRVVIRTDRMGTAELDGLELGDPRVITHRSDPSIERRGYHWTRAVGTCRWWAGSRCGRPTSSPA
ncbi:hypothetical protein AZG88_02620 [Rhodococcus sp. LB1]|nr:hypothetical protein AZG88_02620 [Rhodococcus sp. LB1]